MLLPQILLQWNIQRGVPVIPRSTSEKNIRDNMDSAFDWELTEFQKARAAIFPLLQNESPINNTCFHVMHFECKIRCSCFMGMCGALKLLNALQGQLDKLDRGQRLVNNGWHKWET